MSQENKTRTNQKEDNRPDVERKVEMDKKFDLISTLHAIDTKIHVYVKNFRQFVRTHMPHFHYAWHAKADVHVFRYTFLGLIFLMLIVALVALANINNISQRSLNTRADEEAASLIVASSPQSGTILKIEKTGERRVFGYYIEFNNEIEGKFEYSEWNQYFPDDVESLSSPGGTTIAVARSVGGGNTEEARDVNREGFILSDATQLFAMKAKSEEDVVDIKSAYVYYVTSTNEGKGFTITEELIFGSGGPAPTQVPDGRPIDLDDEDSTISALLCPPDYENAYWDDTSDANDPKCICHQNGSNHVELRKSNGGKDVTKEQCNDATVGFIEKIGSGPTQQEVRVDSGPTQERVDSDPVDKEDSIGSGPLDNNNSGDTNNACSPGEEAYIDTFSESIGASEANPICLCNKSYKIVDMSVCAQDDRRSPPPSDQQRERDGGNSTPVPNKDKSRPSGYTCEPGLPPGAPDERSKPKCFYKSGDSYATCSSNDDCKNKKAGNWCYGGFCGK